MQQRQIGCAVALLSVAIVLYLWGYETLGENAANLWWQKFPTTAMAFYRIQKHREVKEDFFLNETSYKVYYDEAKSICAIDTSQIYAVKLFHSIYDDALRGISSCCTHRHGRPPNTVVLVNMTHGPESDKIEKIFQLYQDLGPSVSDAGEFTRQVESELDSMTQLHNFENISFSSLQWHRTQSTEGGHVDPYLLCGLEFLHRLFTRQLLSHSSNATNTAPETNSEKLVMIWGRGNGTRSLVNQEQLTRDLEAGLREIDDVNVVNVLDPDELTMDEQLALISRASVFISPHGAGLSLILALPKNALVLELYAVEYMEHWLFKNIASMLRLQHSWIPCVANKNDTRFDAIIAPYLNAPMLCNSDTIVYTISTFFHASDNHVQ